MRVGMRSVRYKELERYNSLRTRTLLYLSVDSLELKHLSRRSYQVRTSLVRIKNGLVSKNTCFAIIISTSGNKKT